VLDLSEGQIVADKYRIDGVMGTGGMGVVVAATHVELDQRVAIKFLREISTEALARFHREARLLVRLKSPHVAKVFDVGTLEDGSPFIVMEHLEGSDLSTVLGERKKLPHEEALDYVLQAGEAIAEAHALGMVHRDLKPVNLFLARGAGGRSSVKVLDFGISKIRDDRLGADDDTTRGRDLTHEGAALGSPGYMSPEQMTSARDVDARADIFAVGAILYRLITGQPPYRGKTVVSLLTSMATEPVTPMKTLAPEIPTNLGTVIEQCLAQDREARWPTLAHLAHALSPFSSIQGRMSIEQILATLDFTVPTNGMGETRVRPPSSPDPRPSPEAQRASRAAAAGAGAGAARPSQPSVPKHATPRRASRPRVDEQDRAAQKPLIVIAVAAAVVIVGLLVSRAMRRPTPETVDPSGTQPTLAGSADEAEPGEIPGLLGVGSPPGAPFVPDDAGGAAGVGSTRPPRHGPRWPRGRPHPHGSPPQTRQ